MPLAFYFESDRCSGGLGWSLEPQTAWNGVSLCPWAHRSVFPGPGLWLLLACIPRTSQGSGPTSISCHLCRRKALDIYLFPGVENQPCFVVVVLPPFLFGRQGLSMEPRLTWNYGAEASLQLMIFLPHPPSTVIVDCTTTQGINASYLCGLVTPVSICALVPSCQERQEQLSHGVVGEIQYGSAHKGFQTNVGP